MVKFSDLLVDKSLHGLTWRQSATSLRRCISSMCEHYAKFKYKGKKTVGDSDYTNQTPTKHFGWQKCQVQHSQGMSKYLSNMHKIGVKHPQCVNNQYVKFEYKGIFTFSKQAFNESLNFCNHA